MRFEKKRRHIYLNPDGQYMYIIDLIPKDLKDKVTKKATKKSLFKSFCFNSKGTNKVKDFEKVSSKVIDFLFQSNNTKYIKLFIEE